MHRLENAGLRVRAQACAIDLALLLAAFLALVWLLHGAPPGLLSAGAGAGEKYLRWFLPGVSVIACWWIFGATPGKMVMGIKVLDAKTGEGIGLWQCVVRWLAFLLAAAPLGAGFLWAAIEPRKRGLHDKLAGTVVVVNRPDFEAACSRKAPSLFGFVQAHWRGELALPVSFWLNTVLLLLPLLIGAAWLGLLINFKGEFLRIGSTALLVVWPLLLVLMVWSCVGTWRAASEYVRCGADPRWSMAVQAVLGLLAAAILASTLFELLPRLGLYVQLAGGSEPFGHAEMSLSKDGERVSVSGNLGTGDGERFLDLVGGAPKVGVIEIESPGGRLVEFRHIAGFVEKNKLRARITGACNGGCGLVFFAAVSRQLMPGASLGLSKESARLFQPLLASVVDAELTGMFTRLGAPAEFMLAMQRTPVGALWRPTQAQLEDADLIAMPKQTLDIDLPEADAGKLADLLRGNPAWYWLDQSQPGLIDLVAAHMARSLAAPGSTQVQVLAEAQAVVSAMLPGLLQNTSNELRSDYLAIWNAQLNAARQQGASQCAGVLAGNAGIRRQLPEELVARESAWLVRAAMSAGAGAPPFRPINSSEILVLGHQLGDRAPALLSGLFMTARKRPGSHDCARTIEILAAVEGLPGHVRPIAARALFQNP